MFGIRGGVGDGIVGVGWQEESRQEPAAATPLSTTAGREGRGVQLLKLEEEERKRNKDLDPWRSQQYHPIPIQRRENERKEEEEQQQQGTERAATAEYAERMAEGQSQHHHHDHQVLLLQQHQSQQPLPQRPRFGRGPRSIPGEIVEVQGGHIVRSTGRKDRHSKVCTAKGPRDRRVRLSAHTAIQFYDVQDRLGYDRPSKAVDWLMKNAKAAIDELEELPAWHPTATTNPPPLLPSTQQETVAVAVDSSKRPMTMGNEPCGTSRYSFFVGSSSGGGGSSSSSFLPPSLDSDAIADTIKSFFPIAASSASPSPTQPLGSYPNYLPDLLSRSSSQSQDLRLSLQSFQDPIYSHQHHHHNPAPPAHHALFSSSHNVAYDAAAAAVSMPTWNVAETGSGGDGSGGTGTFVFNVPPLPQAVPLHSMLGQGQFFTQRGPLQSSSQPFVRAWMDSMALAAADHPLHQMLHQSVPPIGFAPGSGGGSTGGFSGFRIPARYQGEEENDGISDKPSSASSGSHH